MTDEYNLNEAWLQAMEIEDLNLNKKSRVKKAALADKAELMRNLPKGEVKPVIVSAEVQKGHGVGEALNKDIVAKAREIANEAATLEDLRTAVMQFDGCQLKFAATNTVFGDGEPSSDIMLIGEAPGATEDAKGIPFCGESGKLLDNMLASIKLVRSENFYITNTVFWRPPANRAPTTEEIEICRPFVEKHIALVKPKLLVLVGATAVTSLLGNHLQISKIRQEYYNYINEYLSEPVPTTAIFHPAYLLRQPMQKKTSWYDLLKIRDYAFENRIKI